MGVVVGNDCCMVNVLCLVMCYGNFVVLEDGYGINFLFLVIFVMEIYVDDFCILFGLKVEKEDCIYNVKILCMIG